MKLRLLSLSLLITFYSLFPLARPTYAQSAWTGECVADTDVATIKGIGCLLQNVLTVALQLLGIVLFIMLVIGGVKYLTSGGDPKAVESAQKTITSALMGLVLAIIAWFVLVFIKQLTGVDVTTFSFPTF